MRFNTIPQVLAYYRTARASEALGGKLEIVGAFLENNSVADLYEATIEADIIRPEHHLQLPFVSTPEDDDEGGVGDTDEADRIEMVRMLAKRATLPSANGDLPILACRVPLRGLPSATGSMRQTPHADLIVQHSEGLGIARARLLHHHPLVATIEALHHLAHINKPRVRERLFDELQRTHKSVHPGVPINRAMILAPGGYYDQWLKDDKTRRSGLTNADVTRKVIDEMATLGVRVSLWRIEGNWKAGLFTVGQAGYAPPPAPADDVRPAEEPAADGPAADAPPAAMAGAEAPMADSS